MDYIGLNSFDSKHACGFTLYLKYIINHSFQKFPRDKFLIEILSSTHDLSSHKENPAKMYIYHESNSEVITNCHDVIKL